MRESTRQVLFVCVALLFATLAFQQCAPTHFEAAQNELQKSSGGKNEGAVAETDDLPGNPGPVEIVDDPVLGEVPVVDCPTDDKNTCKDKSIDSSRDTNPPNQIVKSTYGGSQNRVQKEKNKCAVICHLPSSDMDKAKTLYVGLSAVDAHVKNHGDLIGPCPAPSPTPTAK